MTDTIKTDDLNKVVGGGRAERERAFNSVEYYALLFFDFTYNIDDKNLDWNYYNKTVNILEANGYEVKDYKLYKDGILITKDVAEEAFRKVLNNSK